MLTSNRETNQGQVKAAEQADQPAAELHVEPRVDQRIDAAHLIGDAATPPAADNAAVLRQAAPTQAEAEQLRVQAEQLARHLDTRQEGLDHREAQVNAITAQLDRDARIARLWLSERQAELQRHSEELAAEHREVQGRLERLAAAEAAQKHHAEMSCNCARREAELAAQQKQLADLAAAQEEATRRLEAQRRQSEDALLREKQQIDARREASLQLVRQLLAGVERRRQAIEAEAQTILQRTSKASPQLLAREEALRRSAQELEARARQLEQSEARLADAHAETRKLQQELLEQRRTAEEETRTERERLAAEHGRASEELERRRQAIQRRSEHVDQCRLALQQLRSELGRMHRETLEIRLATEELWVQLSGAAPAPALVQSLGRIRTKLSEHYRLANAELQAQKAELESIRGQLAEQFAKVTQQKRQFDAWAAAGQEEIDRHAARLVAREQQLRDREIALEESLHRWQAERLEYQQKIRRLQARHTMLAESAAL